MVFAYFSTYLFIFAIHREWLTPNALQQSIAIQNQERDADANQL